MRSWLFVPADSERKLAKGAASQADVLLVDLEDSVAASAKAVARGGARAFLAGAARSGGQRVVVRINSLESGLAEADLAAVVPAGAAGIMLPKCRSGRDVQQLSARLAVLEAESGFEAGAISIVAIATETAASLFHMGSYAGASRRLTGLAWGAEDLSADIGAEASRDAQGQICGPYALARSLTLLGAAAASVAAIDTVYVDFRDPAGLARECDAARRDGFVGKMAIHPAQVDVINTAFTPSAAAVAHARAVVAAFAAVPGTGVVALDGQMYDKPHLLRAERVLARRRGDN